MNDVDGLRAALRRPPEEPFAEPDLARIMADGTRLRRRRRLLSGTAGVAAAAAVVLVVVFAVRFRQPAAPVARQPPPVVSATVPSPVPSPASPPPLGAVVGTGIQTPRGEIVLYARAVDQPQALPGVHFGLTVGFRRDGALEPVLTTNEFRGSDRSFGFHATDGGEVLHGVTVPVFGYFAGAAARITTTVHGKTVEAKLAKWTEDQAVVIFWFDPALVPDADSLTPLIAYAPSGNRLTK